MLGSPGSVRCFHTVPSVAQYRVMSNEEASLRDFPRDLSLNFTLRPPARNNERSYLHFNLPERDLIQQCFP
jgi:hypothetical protein